MVKRACPICGNGEESKVFAEANFNLKELDQFAFASRKLPEYMHFRLIDCPTCDVVYANPTFSIQEIATAYEEADFGSQEEARFAAHTYGRFLTGIIPNLADLEGALDIGTGDGAFLEVLLTKGFTQVNGIEPSKAPIRAAKKEIQPLIKKGLFNSRSYHKNTFSLVTCFQTLEHLADPMETVLGIYQILKEKGALFIVSHNREALSARVLGRKSPIFDIEHLQLFSFQSVKNLMEKAGFSHIDVKPIFNTYPLHYWLKLLPVPTKLKTSMFDWLNKTGIGKWPVALPAGNMAVVGYKQTVTHLKRNIKF